MKKGMVLVLMAILFGAPVARAAETALPAVESSDVGNKFCPVSGDKISGKHFSAYNGKRYGMCCPMCGNKFKRDPEKYLKKMASQEAAHDHQH